jgi:long-chain acyl-CoA synthetase
MIAEKLFSVPEGEKLKLFGIFSKNRAEWTITDIAANLFGMTTIPIYDTLGDENITYVFNHTQMTTVFVNEGALKSLTKCKDLVKVNTIVCFDQFTEDKRTEFQERGNEYII